MLELGRTALFFALSISILAMSGYFCYLLFNWAKMTKETTKTLENVNKKLEKIDPLLDEATRTVTSLLGTVKEIDRNFLKPIASLSQVVKKFRNIFGIFNSEEE